MEPDNADAQRSLAEAMRRAADARRVWIGEAQPSRRERRRHAALTLRVKVRRGANLCRRRYVREVGS